MDATEAKALGVVAADLVEEVVTLVEDVHHAIARRIPFSAVPLKASRVVTHGVYGATRTGLKAGAKGLGHVASMRSGTPSADSPRGGSMLAFLSGLLGSELEQRQLPLHPVMGLRRAGRAVPVLPESLPASRPRIVVFVHGLVETERAWWRTPRGHEPAPSFGDRLRGEGWTPLYLRYNTGAAISLNAERLATLLREVVEAWPVEVEEIALVGHSMGGIVARRAAALASDLPITEIVCLGSPHRGSHVAVGAQRLVTVLQRFPETAPVGRLIDRRSAGIRDLEPDEFDGCATGARQHVVAATISPVPESVLGRLLGDGLVVPASATAGGDFVQVLGGLQHFDVLNHPRVWPIVQQALRRT